MHDGSRLPCPALSSDRLLLRRPDDGDVDAIVRLVGHREVARRLARVPHPYGREDARFFLDKVVPNEWVWAITLIPSGAFVGVAGLTPTGVGEAELGYWIGVDHWGKGIATEAARAVLDFGLSVLGLHCVTSGYHADNPASGRVLEKLGFVVTGRARRPSLAAGAAMPSVEMRLSR